MKQHSATGFDKIHNLMIKNSTCEFKKLLLNLINQTIKYSLLPQDWKDSTITMIPKKSEQRQRQRLQANKPNK